MQSASDDVAEGSNRLDVLQEITMAGSGLLSLDKVQWTVRPRFGFRLGCMGQRRPGSENRRRNRAKNLSKKTEVPWRALFCATKSKGKASPDEQLIAELKKPRNSS
jgi:hypothetical protein